MRAPHDGRRTRSRRQSLRGRAHDVVQPYAYLLARWLKVGLTALVVFVLTEVVCRPLLHLSDGVVPIIVLPLTALAVGIGIGLTRNRAQDA